jgi:hypothetical protein
MTFSTHENYDENEYFLRFHNIHPILIYSNNEYDKQKKELQIKLLDEYKNNKITKEQLEINYNMLIDIERQYEHKQIQKNIKENNEKLLINYIKNFN